MFKVTLHAGNIKEATLHNTLGKLDFGYATLDAVATYKAELFTNAIGSHGLTFIENYPRWSASIWDLIARVVCKGMYLSEELPEIPAVAEGKGRAYARRMCAIVEHWKDGEETRRARVGTAQLTMQERRCLYICELEDDLVGTRTSRVFGHAPERLQHWDLLCRAVNWTDAGAAQIPPRPPYRDVKPFIFEGESYIGIGRLKEPARTGLLRWMAREGLPVRHLPDAPSGILAEKTYEQFLRVAL